MMTETGTYPYYRASTFTMVGLPYTGNRFMMYVLLPNDGVSLRSISSGLSAARWSRWTGQLTVSQGTLSLPRFSLRTDYSLIPPLSAMGMSAAFGDSADFSGMCVRPCRISEVRHKAFLAVNEKGTVASAATSVGVEPTAALNPTFSMVVNRPFLVTIADRRTGAVLFAGTVNNPKG
jgi:serpin B